MKNHLSTYKNKLVNPLSLNKCQCCETEFINIPLFKGKSGFVCELCLENAGPEHVKILFGEK